MRQQLYNSDIYPAHVIHRAISSYKTIATIVAIPNSGSIRCLFISSKYDIDITTKEFGNYLIELINSKGTNDDLD